MSQVKLSIVISTMGSVHLEGIVKNFLSGKQAVEVILVFDNPSGRVESFLSQEQRADPRLKLIINESNMGLTRSLNKGIANAAGDIIVRSDDDDFSMPERLDELAACFIANPKTDLVYSYAEGIDEESGKIWTIQGPQEDRAIKEKLLKRNFIVHSSLAFRRERLAQIGFYDETFRYAQDYDLYLRSIRAGLTFGCIPRVLVRRVYHKNSITVLRRKRQILNSMAARILHAAQRQDLWESPWLILVRYAILLVIPNWARNIRRKLGLGK